MSCNLKKTNINTSFFNFIYSGLIDFGEFKTTFLTIEEILIVGTMFLAIYLKGFSVTID